MGRHDLHAWPEHLVGVAQVTGRIDVVAKDGTQVRSFRPAVELTGADQRRDGCRGPCASEPRAGRSAQ
jgi:hypothetical protein